MHCFLPGAATSRRARNMLQRRLRCTARCAAASWLCDGCFGAIPSAGAVTIRFHFQGVALPPPLAPQAFANLYHRSVCLSRTRPAHYRNTALYDRIDPLAEIRNPNSPAQGSGGGGGDMRSMLAFSVLALV